MLLACACASPAPEAGIGVANGTTLAVTLVVNGSTVRSVAPGRSEEIPPGELPALPWRVEARSPRGRVLTALTVNAGDVRRTTTPNGGTEYRGDATRVDLSCGSLDVWSGLPLAGPPPGPGSAGDCAP